MKKLKTFVLDVIDSAWRVHAARRETLKFRGSKRKEIYESVTLTSEQKKEIDTLYKENYGKKIPYTWHKHYTAFTGSFDAKYVPELLYSPEFEHFENSNIEYAHVLSDKNLLPILAEWGGVKTPQTIISCTFGIYRDKDAREIRKEEVAEFLKNQREVFVKPSVDTGSGKGCFVSDFKDGVDIITGTNITNLLQELGDNFVVQKRIKCHESITRIYPKSVNTFRIITYRWKDRYCHMPIIMRIGQGGNYLDNAHAGGMFIALDDDGTMHKTAFTEFKKEFQIHPDTKLKFDGYKIDLLPKVITAAERMCLIVPQIGCINWDFTIDEEGDPVLIEANTNGGSIWLSEMAHGCGAFGANTEDVLKWLALMIKIPASKREKYKFGNGI